MFYLVQVRQALERPLGSLYISKDHLSIELSKDLWLKYVCIILLQPFFIFFPALEFGLSFCIHLMENELFIHTLVLFLAGW